MEEMKKRLVDAIKGCCDELCGDCDWESCETCSLFDEFQKEADALLLAGVLVPPVKLGDTVYAVAELDEPEIYEYAVGGFEYSGGEWYVQQEGYKDCFKVGSDLLSSDERGSGGDSSSKGKEVVRWRSMIL